MYAPNAEVVHGPDGLQFVVPPGFTAGDFGFATTAHCLEGTALAAKAHYSGQGLLGDAAAVLVGMEAHALSSSNRTQSLVGIEPVSSCIGHGDRSIKLARAGSA